MPIDDIAVGLVAGVEGGDWTEAVLVPGDAWTVQDVVTLCLAASSIDVGDWNDRGLPCALASAPPKPAVHPEDVSAIGAPGLEELLAPPAELPSPGPRARPSIEVGDAIVLGALDKAVIDSVVRMHLAPIRYCYERELRPGQALAGKHIVKFVIAQDGSVSSATTKRGSTLNNDAAQTCMNKRFMRMRFPEPAGGGIVIVSYPMVFSVE